VEIPLELSRPAGGERDITLEASFQGCLDEGICYPPMTRSLALTLPPAQAAAASVGFGGEQGGAANVTSRSAASTPAEISEEAVAAVVPQAEHDRLAAALDGRPLMAMGLFLIAGLLLAFTP